MTQVAIVTTGVANVASVRAGLRRAGAESACTTDPSVVREASHVMLPGVGAFGAAMEVLAGGLDDALRERIEANRPTLAICLGLQLLCLKSAETEGVKGLGCWPVEVGGWRPDETFPQMGWSRVAPAATCRLLASGYAYFANSYRVVDAPPGWEVATAEFEGQTYVAAAERGNVLACQFHPELSGKYGKHLLRAWIELEAN